MKKKRILINNYYSGIVSRGIITQVENLCVLLDDMRIEYRVLRSPRFLRRLPRQGVLFHAFEQLYVPLVGLFYDVVLYPYNSASIFSCFHKGSVLVVHDFIQNRPKLPGYQKISALLVRITQCIYQWSGRDVAFISAGIQRQARWINRFSGARQFVLPNCFTGFRKQPCGVGSVPEGRYILLCTGLVPTKDLPGALLLYRASARLFRLRLFILGLGGNRNHFERVAQSVGFPEHAAVILGKVSDESLKEWYSRADIVWVHSRHEGFGRSVTEATLCGAKVVASKISSFRDQSRHLPNIFLYNNDSHEEFLAAIDESLRSHLVPVPNLEHYEEILRHNIQRLTSW